MTETKSVSTTNKNWYDSPAQTFGVSNPKTDDLLHPHDKPAGDWLTETQYFGLAIPEHNIYGFFYFWLHPNLNVLSGGLFVCRGLKQNYLQAELYDMIQNNKADTILVSDLHSYAFPNGYRVDLLEGGHKLRIRYEDESRGNSVDFTATSVMPIAMRANNRHFEQAMRTEGQVTLRGRRHDFKDTYMVRDRSWGEMRNAAIQSLPSMSWLTGTFGDDFAFNVNAFDNPARGPDWIGKMSPPKPDPLNDGWVWYDGRLAHIVSVDKLTVRDPANGRPLTHDFTMTDEMGRVFAIKGKITAGFPWACWWNLNVHLNLTRWDCNGRVGWGDTQECQWNDYAVLCTDPTLPPILD